jgi:hypothetical protein
MEEREPSRKLLGMEDRATTRGAEFWENEVRSSDPESEFRVGVATSRSGPWPCSLGSSRQPDAARERTVRCSYNIVVTMRPRRLDLIGIVLTLVAVAAAYSLGLLPGQVYGALLGALLTLLGVQLKSHQDATLKRIELRHNLRREVYLEVAEGIADSLKYLEELAQPNVDEQQAPRAARRGWVQKLELVATLPTVLLARAAGTVHNEIVLDLMKRRAKISKLDFEIKIVDDQHSRLLEVQGTVFKQFSDALHDADPIQRDQKVLTASAAQDALHEGFARNEAEQSRISKERSLEHRELARAALRGSIRYGRGLTALQNAIRSEIGGLDEEQPATVPVEQGAESEKQLEDFMDYIEQLWKRESDAD